MKTMLKITLMFALMGSTIFADGQMGSGGRSECTQNCPPPPPCTANCGGFAAEGEDENTASETADFATEFVVELVEAFFLN